MTGFLERCLVVLLHFKHGGRLKQDDFETKMSESILWQCDLIPARANLGLTLLRVRSVGIFSCSKLLTRCDFDLSSIHPVV